MGAHSEASGARALTPELFTELVRECRPRLVSRVASEFGYSLDAEHIVQQALLKAWQARDRFDPRKGEFPAWVLAIARNTARDEQRHRQRRGEPVPIDEIEDFPDPDPFADPAAAMERRRQDERVRSALDRLPEPDRAVIFQTRSENRSLRATAALLHLSLKQVRCARDRAGLRLRRELRV